MKQVILDTSFILTALQFKIRIKDAIRNLLDANFELVIVDKTLKELEGKKQGELAKAILEKEGVKIIATSEPKNVDNLILSRAKLGSIVATQDKKLKERLKKREIPVIAIRQKSHIQFV